MWASLLAGKDSVIAEVRAEMTRRDPDRRHTWVIVTDGERALQRRVTSSFTDVTLVLDLLHVMEKLWKVGNALHPEGSPEAIAFVRERADRILCGEVSQVVKGFRSIVTKRALKGEKANTLTSVANYLYANRGRMRYDLYLDAGGRSRAARSRERANASSATASNEAACAGPRRWPRPCSNSEPSTSQETGTRTGGGTCSKTRDGSTTKDIVATRPKVATPNSFAAIRWVSSR